MSKKFTLKVALFGVVITLVLGSLVILSAKYISQPANKQDLRSRATSTGPSSVLFFDPASISLEPSQTSTVTININPNNNQVFGIQLSLNFDPAKIKINSFTPSASFSNVLASPQIDNTGGTIYAVLTVPFPTQPTDPNAAGIPPSPVTLPNTAVATVSFQTLQEGSPLLSFTSNTIVVAKDETINVLASSTPLTINVNTPSPTVAPTNTPTPTTAPIATATPTPTLLPETTPSPTLEPGVTATPSPTPVPLLGDIYPPQHPDGKVDIFDFALVVQNFNKSETNCVAGWNIADIVPNCRVDIFDFALVVQEFGRVN